MTLSHSSCIVSHRLYFTDYITVAYSNVFFCPAHLLSMGVKDLIGSSVCFGSSILCKAMVCSSIRRHMMSDCLSLRDVSGG